MKSATKWKAGDVARFPNHRCPRYVILNGDDDSYCCMSDSGTVCYHKADDLLTLEEWIKFADYMREDWTGKEYRERIENARKPFVPPPWWDEAMARAMEPFK